MLDDRGIIDTVCQQEIIDQLCQKLLAGYIFPEQAKAICAYLQQALTTGEYDEYTDGRIFALALTMHMQEICQDEHLWVRWHADPLPEFNGALYQSKTWLDEQRKVAEQDNFGFHKLERLPGNIGYLDIRQFHRAAWGSATAAAAMTFLANTQALIIDLRNCLGGHADMVVLISSYLFGDVPVHLGDIYWRDEDTLQEYWTHPVEPSLRFVDKPVYLLTSKATFSAGEAFAKALQIHERALVVGEQTDGGSHPGVSYRINPHFEAFIPVGRAILPIIQEDWECKGVSPDILVPAEQALKSAYHLAFELIFNSNKEPFSDLPFSLKEEAEEALQENEIT